MKNMKVNRALILSNNPIILTHLANKMERCLLEVCNSLKFPYNGAMPKTTTKKGALIPLFMGTSWSFNHEEANKPLLALREQTFKSDGDRHFDIRMGSTTIGELHYNPKTQHYSLGWLATGGNFCGTGELLHGLDVDDKSGLPSSHTMGTLTAHIFEVLARNERDYVSETYDDAGNEY